MVRVLRERGHQVVDVIKSHNQNYDGIDLVIDVDCGRNDKGELIWQAGGGRLPVPSAVMFIDSHGWPTVHKRVSRNYDHVFFAVWSRRDLFAKHPSAHWCPNFTDLKWFNGAIAAEASEEGFDFGFYGSKGGLSRANPLIEVANKRDWTHDVRQISANGKHRWPQTADAMGECRNLFNHGQKHDGPNLRVMESMLMMRPLITDWEAQSGMDKLFKPGEHYLSYDSYTYEGLEMAMQWAMDNPAEAAQIAANAYLEVRRSHLVDHRIDQILEVFNA
jgi:hypothetical protein